ncbi:cation:H+ antiporter [Limimonas halophila]|uniref:Cation:H+ antiporter n=1 Tax=Limimonas halophila TaxID=1082479 RepID=A0A1G7UX95_9PROT|nr:calcium/sodium antiporter [Limimonas halophila]SDG52225.1 cation:H+ antiporter [Limimonas halophila]
MDYIYVVSGLVLLFLGGESVVRGAVGLARRAGVSPLFTGLVIVGFGTSAPEFLVTLQAALTGHHAITVGNILGSNVANLMLILGTAAVIQPVLSRWAVIRRDGVAMVAASAVFVALGLYGEITRALGLAMVVALAGFIGHCYRTERRGEAPPEHATDDGGLARRYLPVGIAFTLVGIAGLVGGSRLLVDGASAIATRAGISEAVIGVTLVAIGTSLPELATAIVAAIRRHPDVALGNALGSNVFNVFGMLGLTAAIVPVQIAPAFLRLDLWLMLAVSVLLIGMLITGHRLARSEGVVLLLAYAGYVALLFSPYSAIT